MFVPGSGIETGRSFQQESSSGPGLLISKLRSKRGRPTHRFPIAHQRCAALVRWVKACWHLSPGVVSMIVRQNGSECQGLRGEGSPFPPARLVEPSFSRCRSRVERGLMKIPLAENLYVLNHPQIAPLHIEANVDRQVRRGANSPSIVEKGLRVFKVPERAQISTLTLQRLSK